MEFHNTYNCYIQNFPGLPDNNIRQLRKKLLNEEFNEYLHAMATYNRVEIADALGDMTYILFGTLISYGIEINEYFNTIDSFLLESEGLSLDEIFINTKKSIITAFDIYIDSEDQNDLDKIRNSLSDLLFNIEVASRVYNIPLEDVFNEIHRSNMSKLDDNGKPIYREDGKVLKGKNYSPPDISKIINKHLELT